MVGSLSLWLLGYWQAVEEERGKRREERGKRKEERGEKRKEERGERKEKRKESEHLPRTGASTVGIPIQFRLWALIALLADGGAVCIS